MNLLDFGSTGILDPSTLEALGGLLLASTLNDPALLQRAVLAISPPPPGTDLTALEADLGRFMVMHVSGGTGFDVGMLKAMIEVLQRNHLPGADVAHAAQPRADHAGRDAADHGARVRVRRAGPGPGGLDDHAGARHGRGQRPDAEGAAARAAVTAHAARPRRSHRRAAALRSAHAPHPALRGRRRSGVRARPGEPGDARGRRARRHPHLGGAARSRRRAPPTRPRPRPSRASATSGCSSAP